ncbi:MAG TPA: insulinase family protein [Pyrinomonadaceae bacterium]|nr:insulinase family protein [Pyrinomonadaceae bacterium]
MKLRADFGPRVRKIVRAAALLSILCAQAPAAPAGQSPEPRRETLLNGLRVLLLPRGADAQALVKLRLHSGAAFDLAGKEGVMALLGDALFPDPATREYVTEDLGGRLEVATNYDSIDVTLTGKADEYERLIELLRGAVVSTQLSPEVVTRLRDARLKAVRDVSISPATVADRAVAARLFGKNFPYGRVVDGTPESLAAVERADLLLVRERFLNPNNATLTVAGVEPSRAMRAVRQYLGPWRKSDREVPATFRQPEEPADAGVLLVNFPGTPDAEVRLASRGLARSDRDAAAARVVATLARERWQKRLPALKGRPLFVEHRAYTLPGVFRMGASVPTGQAGLAIQQAELALRSLVQEPPAAEELELARREVLAALNGSASRPDGLADLWLDREQFRTNADDEARTVSSLTSADVRRVAERLLRGPRGVAVAVGDAAQLQPVLAEVGKVDLSAVSASASGAAAPQPTPQPSPQSKPFSFPVRRP